MLRVLGGELAAAGILHVLTAGVWLCVWLCVAVCVCVSLLLLSWLLFTDTHSSVVMFGEKWFVPQSLAKTVPAFERYAQTAASSTTLEAR